MFLHLYVFVCAHAWVCVTSRPAEACVLCVAPGNAGESNLGPWKPTRCAFLHPESWWADFFLINSSPDTTSTSNQTTHPFTVKQGQSSGHSHLPHLFGNQSVCKLCCFAFLSRYNSFFGAFSEIVRKTFSHNLICTWKDNMAYFTLPVPVCCYCSNVQNRRTALITTVDGAQSVIQTSCRSITQVH